VQKDEDGEDECSARLNVCYYDVCDRGCRWRRRGLGAEAEGGDDEKEEEEGRKAESSKSDEKRVGVVCHGGGDQGVKGRRRGLS
jgi:hypothetical protein